jgi:multidrug efflux pump subunit AcrB
MGISGRVARYFLDSRLTPLIAVLVVVLGLFAVLATPREEEPQVDVTMANVLIPFPGASAADVEMLVATPVEQVISQMPGLEHVFSVSQPGLALVTAQFKVGVPRMVALVRLYDTIPVEPRLDAGATRRRRALDQAEGDRRRAQSSRSRSGRATRRGARSISSRSRTRSKSS